MRHLLLALCLSFATVACGGPANSDDQAGLDGADGENTDALTNEADDALPPTGFLRSAYAFEIKSGHHRGSHDFVARPHFGKHVDRALTFRAVFAADVPYTTSNPSNQSDYNKLMGISSDRIHKNSIRIGWAWNPAKQMVDLGFYGYLDGQRVMQPLTSVAPGQSIDCELRMTNNGLYARAGSASFNLPGSLGVSFPTTWILHSAYFGGDEKAPHDLHVSVSGVAAQ